MTTTIDTPITADQAKQSFEKWFAKPSYWLNEPAEDSLYHMVSNALRPGHDITITIAGPTISEGRIIPQLGLTSVEYDGGWDNIQVPKPDHYTGIAAVREVLVKWFHATDWNAIAEAVNNDGGVLLEISLDAGAVGPDGGDEISLSQFTLTDHKPRMVTWPEQSCGHVGSDN
jgi:hypothetical protein